MRGLAWCQSQTRGDALPGPRKPRDPGHLTRLCLHVLHTDTRVSVQKAGREPFDKLRVGSGAPNLEPYYFLLLGSSCGLM